LKLCFGELVSFSCIFFLIWFAFVQWMYLIYGTDIEGYASLTKSMESAFSIMLGKFDKDQFFEANSIMGPLVFSLYSIVMICFTLNIFITIITEAFDQVRQEAKKNPKNFDFMNHVFQRFKDKFFKRNNKISKGQTRTSVVYRDSLSVFPNRINKLINYMFRVNIFFAN
jgi:hypothetical protein